MTPDHRAKYQRHPLDSFAGARFLHPKELMNILQDRGMVSDNCVRTTEVHPDDVDRVLIRGNARWAKAGL